MTYGQALLLLNNSAFQTQSTNGGITITVRMKGESPEAHAAAVLAYFGYTKAHEDTFKVRYGYDLRQSFVETYRRGDRRSAHRAVGNGYYEVTIPLPSSLVKQIESLKSPISSNLPPPDGNSGNNSTGNKSFSTAANATPAEREFFKTLDLLKTEAMNFGSRLIQDSQVRADYLKTIRYASQEFVDLAKSGAISYEEAARRANLLRNYILETSRGKNSELGRSIAEFLKKEGPTFEALLDKYAKQKFQTGFSALSQANKEAVYLEVIVAAGRDRKAVSGIAPYLGKFGKVCLVASIAISVYNVATAEDKVNAAGREGSSILGGIAGGAAGGAVAGLICGPGAPVCSGIGIFVGGAVGAFAAAGGYDWLTSK